MVAVPLATPVTGIWTLLELAGTLIEAGTEATFVLLELRFTVRPAAGAGEDSVSVRFCPVVPVTVKVGGVKARVPVT